MGGPRQKGRRRGPRAARRIALRRRRRNHIRRVVIAMFLVIVVAISALFAWRQVSQLRTPRLTSSASPSAQYWHFTIQPGDTADTVATTIAHETGINVDKLRAVMNDPKKSGLPAEAKGHIEGWLYPSAYKFPRGYSAEQIVQALTKTTVGQLNALGVAHAKWERTLTVASIAQAEGLPTDYDKVARVIENRLVASETGGKIGMDSTIAYGAHKKGTELTKSDLANADNAYNSRIHAGLPPTPIGNPSLAAIQAAIQPAQGNWLYFVTVNLDTGETKFTADYQQFLQYQKEYQQWLKANNR